MPAIKKEQSWLYSTTPHSLLLLLKRKRLPRLRRLFAVACCRRVLGEMPDPESRTAVEVAERYADDLASREELEEAFQAAQQVALRRIERCQTVPVPEQPAAWNEWRLAYAAQLTCAASGTDEASEELLKRARHQGVAFEDQERKAQSDLIRDVFGNPFRPLPAIAPEWLAWREGTVVTLARAAYDERAFDGMPILGDVLEEAGCTDSALLTHCRQPLEHARGCWVLDLLLGKR
jgi:hypothetical protein